MNETKSFEIITQNANFFPIINQISLHMKNLFQESEIINLKIGIEEMLTNAIEHGNLCISFDEKDEAIAEGRFGSLLQKQLRVHENGKKKVYVTSELTDSGLKVVVRDEGEGFDWRKLPEKADENFLSFNGRGIFLTKIFYDDVIYNEKGNEVTIIKRKSK